MGTTVLLAACAGVAVVGCGVTHVTTRPATAAARTAASAASRQRAVADAAAILSEFVVPPGAQRLPEAPAALKVPSTILVSTTLIDDVSFWRAPGRPEAVLAWEQAHLPRRFSLGDADFGPPTWDQMFSLAPIPGVLNVRDLVVEVTDGGSGRTAIRVDAQVSWQPSRPANELVPSLARAVTVTWLPSPDPHAPRPAAPVTITNLGVVRRLAALVDSLQLSTIPPDAFCPMPARGGIRLTFLATAGGATLAVAQGPAPCGTVTFSVGGKQQPGLQLTDSFIPQVLKLAGLHWKVL